VLQLFGRQAVIVRAGGPRLGAALVICELARQLAGDDWAAHKCESARAACQAAHDSCCACVR
jgi:hypothetical protein